MKDKHSEQLLNKAVQLLTEARKAKKLSHEELAKKAGVTRPAISFMENRKRTPSLLFFIKVSRAMNLSFGEIIKKAEKEIK